MSEKDANFASGAVRSADAGGYSFTSLPMIGLLALARTAGEGAEKYGRFNYLKGMPLHDLLEHSFKHIVMFNAGDRSEPHLAHAAWGLLVAVQEEVLSPGRDADNMLGPGCTITPAMAAHMEAQKPVLAKRRAEAAADAFAWNAFDLADVRKLREQRDAADANAARLKAAKDRAPWATAVNAVIRDYIKERAASRAAAEKAYAPFVAHLAAAGYIKPALAPPEPHPAYGTPTRVTTDHGDPDPLPGETWVEFEGGTRAYYPKTPPVPCLGGVPYLTCPAPERAAPEPCHACGGRKKVCVPGGHGDTDEVPCPTCDPHDALGRPLSACPRTESHNPVKSTPGGYFPTRTALGTAATAPAYFCGCGFPLYGGRCSRCRPMMLGYRTNADGDLEMQYARKRKAEYARINEAASILSPGRDDGPRASAF